MSGVAFLIRDLTYIKQVVFIAHLIKVDVGRPRLSKIALVLESNYIAISSLVGIESSVSIGLRPMFATLVVAEKSRRQLIFLTNC